MDLIDISTGEIKGPSWNPAKKKIDIDVIQINFDKEQNNLSKSTDRKSVV